MAKAHSFRMDLPPGVGGTQYVNDLKSENKLLRTAVTILSIAIPVLITYHIISKRRFTPPQQS
jgi:hypothetical protein